MTADPEIVTDEDQLIDQIDLQHYRSPAEKERIRANLLGRPARQLFADGIVIDGLPI